MFQNLFTSQYTAFFVQILSIMWNIFYSEFDVGINLNLLFVCLFGRDLCGVIVVEIISSYTTRACTFYHFVVLSWISNKSFSLLYSFLFIVFCPFFFNFFIIYMTWFFVIIIIHSNNVYFFNCDFWLPRQFYVFIKWQFYCLGKFYFPYWNFILGNVDLFRLRKVCTSFKKYKRINSGVYVSVGRYFILFKKY